MKIVVVGGSGLIGSKLAGTLYEGGHDVLAVSRATGVDLVTGAGLADALAGAEVVVDVSNARSFEPDAIAGFFRGAGRNLAAAEAEAGVRHHLVLSIVGVDTIPDSPYMRAKVTQEQLVRTSGVPYTIARATQFFEFLRTIADAASEDDTTWVTPAAVQPVAADDVTDLLIGLALAEPLDGVVEIAGPERIGLADAVARVLAAGGDPRTVVPEPEARYFGAAIDDTTLVPHHANPLLGRTTLDRWLTTSPSAAPPSSS